MQEFEEDYYAILGIESDASQEDIRKAYLSLAKKLHPDRFPNDPEQRAIAQKEFAKVTRAHDVVGDADRRLEYDALRQLAKRRSDIVSTGSFVVSSIIPDGERLHEGSGSEAVPIADDSINFKWANKHLGRADELLRKKRYQEAETAMKEAIRLVPTEARYHVKLAEIYLARGWKTLAMTEVQTALRLDASDADAKNLEVQIKALQKEQTASQKTLDNNKKKSGISGIFTQIKDILNKKL
ncbi:MAG: DnaJ domain-containing protein [Candidatus Obscuribacterales bacterium]|jgi:tetratricopeptide (TPR) repeat protein|nr:DnaJ domain-containing protein [Candidatus Obscuribacterales bacterium]